MNIAHIEECSFIYGPGCRYVIWVQGCSIRCPGCWNKHMWSFETKQEISSDTLFQNIKKQVPLIEGITILGGEPLDQFNEVQEILLLCKNEGLSTMLFTGYEMEEIYQKNMSYILNCTDILIKGRYEQTKRTTYHQWIGSTNQKIHFLTPRYDAFKVIDANYVEISIEPSGQIIIYGFPDSFSLT